VPQDGEILWSVAHAGSVLVLIHHDIKPPVQLIFNAPMLADHVVEALGGQRCAEQVIGRLSGGLGRGFADAGDLADGGQARPMVDLLQPVDLARDQGRAGFDAAVIGINGLRTRRRLVRRIVEECADVLMQRALVALQRQDVVAALIDDLPGNGTLAVERVGGHDRALQCEHLQKLRHGGDLIRLGVGGNLRQHKALLAAPRADHVQGRLATGAIEGAAQDLAVNRHDALNRIGETGHELVEGSTEPLRIEQPEQPTEGVVAGQAVLQLEKAA
jgi:hypothetical protein